MLNRLKKIFYAIHLVDVWRVLNPTHRDYTFYSHPRHSYTRIDLFMMPQSFLPRVVSALIGSVTFLDHVPVFMEIDLLSPIPKQWLWKLNDSLIQTIEVIEEVTREMRNFFSSKVAMVWEAHKSYIRGILIKIGSRLKKAKTQQTVDLLDKIRSLEATHKRILAVQALTELSAPAKAVIAKCKRAFYEHSNKCGKLLVRALRAQQV